jgi:hypothetical protein
VSATPGRAACGRACPAWPRRRYSNATSEVHEDRVRSAVLVAAGLPRRAISRAHDALDQLPSRTASCGARSPAREGTATATLREDSADRPRCPGPHDAVRDIRSLDAVRDIRSLDAVRDIRSLDAVRDIRSLDAVRDVRSLDAVRDVRKGPGAARGGRTASSLVR